METVTALMVMIIFCADGSGVRDHKCANGAQAQERRLHVLERGADGESILKYDFNGTTKFVLRPDGSLSHALDFQIDDAALAFWQGVAQAYKGACPSLSEVLAPLTAKELQK